MPQYTGLIESDPQVKMGKPVIAGTRITVESIVGKLAVGETAEQLLAGPSSSDSRGDSSGIRFCGRLSTGRCGLSH